MRLKFRSCAVDESQLPACILSNVEGTWAHDTMSRRVHTDIASRILQDNHDFLQSHDTSRERLHSLITSVQTGRWGTLEPIEEDREGEGDADVWNVLLAAIPESQRNWLDAPWLFAEFYFYRRVINCFQYLSLHVDMFHVQKRNGLMTCLKSVSDVCVALQDSSLSRTSSAKTSASDLASMYAQEDRALITLALYTSLWGNKMDLSLWPAHHRASPSSAQLTQSSRQPAAGEVNGIHTLEAMRSFILDDHSLAVVSHLLTLQQKHKLCQEPVTVDIILDNAGFELVSDLLFAVVLLRLGCATVIRMRCKAYPTFVSDATIADCHETIDVLLRYSEESPSDERHMAVNSVAVELQEYVRKSQIVFLDDVFFCQPIAFWDMPSAIEESLRSSALVIVKGDANYRRLLGDRMWPLHTPAQDVLSYWPVPVCALRALKAELGCGITATEQERAHKADPSWLVSGTWAVLQFYQPPADNNSNSD